MHRQIQEDRKAIVRRMEDAAREFRELDSGRSEIPPTQRSGLEDKLAQEWLANYRELRAIGIGTGDLWAVR